MAPSACTIQLDASAVTSSQVSQSAAAGSVCEGVASSGPPAGASSELAAFAGIAIVGYTADAAKGVWQFSSDGTSWTTLSNVTGSDSAFTLKAIDSLRFVPAENFFGTTPSLTCRLIDSSTSVTTAATVNVSTNGGTTAFSAATVVLSTEVNTVNDAPAGADKTVTVLEDASHTFSAADFGFTDTSDSPANSLSAVNITTLPAVGTLKLDNVAVTAGQSIPAADLGKLVFSPAANANGTGYASFTFQVQDDGGTADGGVDLDQSPNAITVNVTSVNDPAAFSGDDVGCVMKYETTTVQGILVASDVDATQLRNLTVQAVPQPIQDQLKSAGIKVVSTKIGFTAVATAGFIDVDDVLPGVQQRYTINLGSPVDANSVLKIVNGTALVMPLGRQLGNAAGYAELKRDGSGLVTGMVLTITDNGIYDLDPAVNSIVDPVSLGSSDSDLAVAVTDGSANYVPGSTVTYTVTVSNLLGSPATGARITGAGTAASPIVVNVPANGSVVFTVTASIAPTAVRGIGLLVTARPADGQVDADEGNNAAADTDVPLVQPLLVVGSDVGCQSDGAVRLVDPATGATIRSITPWEPGYRGGIRAVGADVTGDGIDEIVMVSGRGRPTELRVFTQWGYELQQYRTLPFGKAYSGGADVAVGNVLGDARPEIVLSMLSGRSLVSIFQVDPTQAKPVVESPLLSFQPFGKKFTGGAAVTILDVGRFVAGTTQDATAGDGVGELAVASGFGMKATVLVYELSGVAPRVVDTITPFGGSAKVGPLSVSSGRFDGDAVDDISVSSGKGIKSRVEVFSGRVDDAQDALLLGWVPFPNSPRPFASVTAVGIDSDRDGKVDAMAAVQGLIAANSQLATAPVSATGTLLAQQAALLTIGAASKAPRLAAVNNRPVTPAIASLFASLGSLAGAGTIAAKQAAFAAIGAATGET